MKVLVSDTNIWIDFHHAGKLHKLFELPYEFVTTLFAFSELNTPDGAILNSMGLTVINQESQHILEIERIRQSYRQASIADLSCFVHARENHHTLLTGDKSLRKLAATVQLECHGSLWLLDELVKHEIMGKREAATCLEKIILHGSYLPASECEKRLAMWK